MTKLKLLIELYHREKYNLSCYSSDYLSEKAKKGFSDGVVLADGTVLLTAVLSLIEDSDNPVFKVIIKEGKYHQIKRMFASFGATVTELKRIAIGGLPLDDSIEVGEARLITGEELKSIVENDERF